MTFVMKEYEYNRTIDALIDHVQELSLELSLVSGKSRSFFLSVGCNSVLLKRFEILRLPFAHKEYDE